MKKIRWKRRISLMFVFVIVVCFIHTSKAEAASWPSISKSKYCEVVANSKINVYNNSSLKTRGTSSPSKKYNAYIASGDVVKVYKITDSYIWLSYPVGSTYREGYIRRKDLFSTSSPSKYISSSKAKVYTYKKKNGNKYGNIAKGDRVWVLENSNGWVRVVYSAVSGKRAFKIGWINAVDYYNVMGEDFSNYYLRALYIAGCQNYDVVSTVEYLYKNFNHRAKYDVKHEEMWNKVFSGYPFPKNGAKVVLFGKSMTAEDVGNAFYGSVGAYIGVSDRTIYQGGGFAKSGLKYLRTPPYYGDDKNDHEAIKYGINLIGGRTQKYDIDLAAGIDLKCAFDKLPNCIRKRLMEKAKSLLE